MTPPLRHPGTGPLLALALLAVLSGAPRAAAQGAGPSAAPESAAVLVSPAWHAGAEPFDPAVVCASVSVPLAESWNVGLVDGRPALALDGASYWSFRALDTWPSGAVKWALCEALVEAGLVLPPPALAVRQGDGNSGAPDLGSETAARIEVDTGPLRVRINKHPFTIFSMVEVDGKVLVDHGTQSGIAAVELDGKLLKVKPHPEVAFEANGPVRTVVRVDGTLQRGNGDVVVDFTCRLAFVRTSRDVEVTFTVRNANIESPGHAQLESIHLVVDGLLGAAPRATFALPEGSVQTPLQPDEWAWAYQARSTAPTQVTTGDTPNYLPHLPKLDDQTYVQEGYAVLREGQVLYSADKSGWPRSAWADLSGSQGGITLAFKQMAYQWPASLQCGGKGMVVAGIFPGYNPAPYTWVWRQHESRTVVFSFHAGPAVAPEQVARRLEAPVVGRMADYLLYDLTGVLAPYDLVSVEEQEQVYAELGVPHTISAPNTQLLVTRFHPASVGGGANNHDWISRALAGEYLRFGNGGAWLNAMDLALYKSEWQILRSDNFEHLHDPGAQNPEVPHSKAFKSDDEHRYREGLALAYWLSGDERIKEALHDEAEILPWIYVWPQERCMYQTLRALAAVATFTHKEYQLDPVLRARLEYFATPQIDVDTAAAGWGWDGPPGQGQRGYFANSLQLVAEKLP
ncbi:MAG TPA: hypothetical protein VFD43_02460, partial [Planctomycetota bacterium]|nr:hypothetical protein [Planctomycetota bacterium]